ncbi:MAG: hypothetical protein IH823_06435 [Candidatus Dadabacteria bacterium]|nr:hypothetical protein [Candidatus Dadabacteria bacterium]
MKKILSEKLPRILKAKKKLEKELNVKISNRGKEVYIKGSPEDEDTAEKVIDAINFGFSIPTAISIKEEGLTFEIINIKDHTHSKNLERVRGRIIGKAGKALQTLSKLTNCYFEIKDNEVGIVGSPEDMENATEAIILLARGAKHGNVYGHLERNQPRPIIDLGLKNKE